MGLIAKTYKFFETYLTENVDGIKSVDLFFNQFETQNTGDSDGRANPRVLILINDFENAQGNRIGGIQNWVGTVTLFIGIDITNTFYSDSELKDKNLEYLSILDDIYLQLSGITSYQLDDDTAYRLYQVQRTRTSFAINEGPIKVSQMDFEFIIEDNSAGRVPIESNVTTIDLDISVSV